MLTVAYLNTVRNVDEFCHILLHAEFSAMDHTLNVVNECHLFFLFKKFARFEKILENCVLGSWKVVVVVTRSDQPKPPTVAIVRQNGLSCASCRASVAVTPVSRQIWWVLESRGFFCQ